MNLKRTADQAGFFGTIIFHALLLFIIMLLMVKCNNEPTPDPLDGAVSVSIGEPEYGGPDQSTEMTEEAQPEPAESNIDEQLTNDAEDAPVVQQTQTKPRNTTTTNKPTEPTKPTRTANPRDVFKPGTGSGSGNGDQSGDQGKPDGTDNGKPDGSGTGSGGEGFSGDGFSGKIDGFKAIGTYKPENNRQEFGKVVVKVCVDKNGKITSVQGGQRGTTNPSSYLRSLSEDAARKFVFQRIGDATNINCGYITFNYKAG